MPIDARDARKNTFSPYLGKKLSDFCRRAFLSKTQIAAARAEAHANAAAAIGSVVAADPVCFAAVAQEASVVAAAAVAPTTFARAAIVVKILLAAENIARVATAAAALPVGTVGDDGRLVQISSYVVADHRHGVSPEKSITSETLSIYLISVHRYVKFYIYGCSRRYIGQGKAVLRVVSGIRNSVYADAAGDKRCS